MSLQRSGLISLVLIGLTIAWPNVHRRKGDIGPTCTYGAHNEGACPDTPPSNGSEHQWPDHFEVKWNMYFVDDPDYSPPYDPVPTRNFTVTKGKTAYDANYQGQSHSYSL